MNMEERLYKISSLLLLSGSVLESQEEPDLYPVEDALKMALDFLTVCIDECQLAGQKQKIAGGQP